MSYIKSLPINDTPEIFALHENANITFAQNETNAMLGGLLLLQPKTSSGGGKSREEVSGRWKNCETLIITIMSLLYYKAMKFTNTFVLLIY